jgi:hypothetical protein
VIETLGRNEKAKEEILKRIQEDTLDAISTLTEDEFERKNKESFIIDNFIRERYTDYKTHLK